MTVGKFEVNKTNSRAIAAAPDYGASAHRQTGFLLSKRSPARLVRSNRRVGHAQVHLQLTFV